MFKYPTNSEVVATVYTPKTEVNASSTQHDPSPRPVGVFAATGRHGHLDRLTGQVGVWVQARRCAEQSTGVQVDHYRQIQFRPRPPPPVGISVMSPTQRAFGRSAVGLPPCVARQVVGRKSSLSKLGMVGSARPVWTSAGRFQEIASWGRVWL